MYPTTSLKYGIVICVLCWLTGTAISLNYTLIIKSNELLSYDLSYTKDTASHLSNCAMILLNNIGTGFILSVFSYFSFGFLSIIVSIYNGYILGLLVNGFVSKYAAASIYLVLLHAPFELFALCYLGAIGLGGFGNLRAVFSNKHIDYFVRFPSFKVFILPMLLLVFAALLESDLLFSLLF